MEIYYEVYEHINIKVPVNNIHNQSQAQDRYTKKRNNNILCFWRGKENIHQHEYFQEWPNDTKRAKVLN